MKKTFFALTLLLSASSTQLYSLPALPFSGEKALGGGLLAMGTLVLAAAYNESDEGETFSEVDKVSEAPVEAACTRIGNPLGLRGNDAQKLIGGTVMLGGGALLFPSARPLAGAAVAGGLFAVGVQRLRGADPITNPINPKVVAAAALGGAALVESLKLPPVKGFVNGLLGSPR